MKFETLVAALALAFSCCLAYAKDAPREVATVVETESTTTPYTWEVAGKVTASCYGDTCSAYYRPPTYGTQNIQGAIIKLRLVDQSVVVARCVGKVSVLGTLIVGAAYGLGGDSVSDPTTYRNCRIPAPNSMVEVELLKSRNTGGVYAAKVFMFTPRANGSDRLSSETYNVLGILQPASSAGPVASASGSVPPAVSSANDTVRLQQLNATLVPLIAQYREIENQSAFVIEQCKDHATDEGCVESFRKLGLAELGVVDSIVPLLDEKMTVLGTLPQNAWVRAEEEESTPILSQMKSELQKAPAILADLDNRLAEFARAKQSSQNQLESTPVPPVQVPHFAPSQAEMASSAPPLETVSAQTSVPSVKQRIQENHVTAEDSSSEHSVPYEDSFLSKQEMLRQIKSGKASRCAIATTPIGAEVYVDGKFAGKTPLEFILVQHDRYRGILVKTAGYSSYETQVWPNGTDFSLNLALEPGQRAEADAPRPDPQMLQSSR